MKYAIDFYEESDLSAWSIEDIIEAEIELECTLNSLEREISKLGVEIISLGG